MADYFTAFKAYSEVSCQTHNPLELPRPEIHIKPDVSPAQARRRTSISHACTRTSLDAHSGIAMNPTVSIQTAMVSCFAMQS